MAFQKFFTFVEIILIATVAFSTAINIEKDDAVNYNLPNYIVPLHYDVKLIFDFNENILVGDCNIIILINNQTKDMTIQPMVFTILNIDLTDYDNEQQNYISKYTIISKLNKLVIDFKTFLSPGKYTLKITYIRIYFESLYHAKRDEM